MRLAILAASAALCLLFSTSTASHAKPRFEQGGTVNCDNRYPATCDGRGWTKEKRSAKSRTFQARRSGHADRRRAASHRHARTPRQATARPAQRVAGQETSQASRSLHGVVGPLAEKAEQIVRECGSWIMSAVRHTQVAGSGRLSCHANGHAVDISGNPACIYRALRGWRGGYSTDYSQVRCRGVSCPHVHVSLGCSEDGKRFVHYGTKVRHARRHRMAKS